MIHLINTVLGSSSKTLLGSRFPVTMENYRFNINTSLQAEQEHYINGYKRSKHFLYIQERIRLIKWRIGRLPLILDAAVAAIHINSSLSPQLPVDARWS
ncbi:unnamed protein product [Cunninghamella echinulata]